MVTGCSSPLVGWGAPRQGWRDLNGLFVAIAICPRAAVSDPSAAISHSDRSQRHDGPQTGVRGRRRPRYSASFPDTSGGQLPLRPEGRDPCVQLSFLYRPASHAAAACRAWTLRCLQAPQPKVSSMSTGRQTVTSGGDATPAASMNGPMSD